MVASPERFDGERDEARRPDAEAGAARRALLRGLLAGPHVLYGIEDAAFVPVASHGLEPWPRFALNGSLARALEALAGPVVLGSHRARRLWERLDPEDARALHGMGVIALLPFLEGDRPVAFLLVGGGFDALDPARVRQLAALLRTRSDLHRVAGPARDPGTGGSDP